MSIAALTALNLVAAILGVRLVSRQPRLAEVLVALVLYVIVWLAIFLLISGRVVTIGNSRALALSYLLTVAAYVVGAWLVWRRRRVR